MPSTMPFIDPVTGELDTNQILSEAIPLAKLVAAVVAVSLLPFGLGILVLDSTVLGAVLFAIGQFVLAVGSGIVLIYVIVRGMHLSGE